MLGCIFIAIFFFLRARRMPWLGARWCIDGSNIPLERMAVVVVWYGVGHERFFLSVYDSE